MWTRPWKLVEGFAVGAGLVLVGLLLQFSAGPIAWNNLSFPVNFIILAGYILVMALVFAFRNKVYSFKFLSSYASAIPALVYAVALTAIMGLTKQMPDGHPAADPLGLSRMLSFWPFVLVYIWISIIVAQATINKAMHFKWRDVPFMLNHAGLLIVMLCATLGNADMQRLKMTIHKSSPEWRATNEQGKIVEMPLAIQLKEFKIYEYPPKLMLVNGKTGDPIPNDKPTTIVVDSSFTTGNLQGWSIKLNKCIDEAAPLMTRDTTNYLPWHSSGAMTAINITATSPNGKMKKTGWVTCGSYLFPYQALRLDDGRMLAMPNREPRRFASLVDIYTKSGQNIQTEIEVNKPFSIEGWTIYQLSYNEQMGKWSNLSIFELVTDPWLPVVYVGIFMLLIGAVGMFLTASRKKENQL